MTFVEWFNLSGTIATWIGLLVSVGALIYAKSAAKRAQEARDAVQSVYLQQALALAVALAKQVVEAVRDERGERALLRADDLRSQLTQLTALHRAKLSSESVSRLEQTITLIETLVALLEPKLKTTAIVAKSEKELLLETCRSVQAQLEREQGAASASQIEKR